MNDKYILLWLEAPLQSWGADSKFGRRDTMLFPTKSGVIGLILCAMGASGEQRELLDQLSSHRHSVISYIKGSGARAGKALKPAVLRDFHMVGSGYDDRDPWETLNIPKTSAGKKAVGGGTKMTYRYYLQDACFAVVAKVPGFLAPKITQALIAPAYDLYLGRKNCVPTEFVYQGAYESEDAALEMAASLMREKGLTEEFIVLEGEHEGDRLTLNDVPVQFGVEKIYRTRRITVVLK